MGDCLHSSSQGHHLCAPFVPIPPPVLRSQGWLPSGVGLSQKSTEPRTGGPANGPSSCEIAEKWGSSTTRRSTYREPINLRTFVPRDHSAARPDHHHGITTMTMLTRGKSEASTRHLVVPARRRVFTQTAQISGTVAKQAKGSEISPMSISPFSNQELPLPIASRVAAPS